MTHAATLGSPQQSTDLVRWGAKAAQDHSVQLSGLIMIDERVRKVVGDHGKLTIDASNLSTDTNLYEAGLTSFATVQLMLALEEEFGVEMPDRLMNRKTFQSIEAITGAIASLLPQTASV